LIRDSSRKLQLKNAPMARTGKPSMCLNEKTPLDERFIAAPPGRQVGVIAQRGGKMISKDIETTRV
jgi:hypothetical protein